MWNNKSYSVLCSNYNPDPDPGHLPHLGIYGTIYITLNKLRWDLLFIFLNPQSGIGFGEPSGQTNCSLSDHSKFFWKKYYVQSHHREICGISSSVVLVSWLCTGAFRSLWEAGTQFSFCFYNMINSKIWSSHLKFILSTMPLSFFQLGLILIEVGDWYWWSFII